MKTTWNASLIVIKDMPFYILSFRSLQPKTTVNVVSMRYDLDWDLHPEFIPCRFRRINRFT